MSALGKLLIVFGALLVGYGAYQIGRAVEAERAVSAAKYLCHCKYYKPGK